MVLSHAYINGTSGFSITCQRGTSVGISLEVFADADYASKTTDRIMRIMCQVNQSWGEVHVCVGFPGRKKCVTLSLSEAEYVALGDAMNELFLRQVLHFMIPCKGMPCFPVFEDNRGALQLSENPVSNSNSKQIDVRHHFLRELVRQGDISENHVPSEYQQADILRKVLAFDFFAIHRRFFINLCD